jgi:hypothetical protein
MTETEKFRTERLVARPWQIADLPLAIASSVASYVAPRSAMIGGMGYGGDGPDDRAAENADFSV